MKMQDACDSVAQACVQNPGGLNRKMLSFYTGISEDQISRVVAGVRDRSQDYGDVFVTVRKGGEYIYAWATLFDDWVKHETRRLRYRHRSARRSELVAEQAYAKFPRQETYAGMIAAKHERENIEVMLARLAP